MRLRSAISVALLACATVTPVSAQKVHIGWKIGLDRAWLVQDGPTRFKPTTDAIAGVFLNLRVAPLVSAQPELLYGGKGATWASDAEIRFSDLELPVLVRFDVRRFGIRPHLLVGPALAFLHSCELEYLVQERPGGPGCAWLTRRESSVVTAGGIDFPTRHATLHLEYRYDRGLSSITEPTRTAHYSRVWAVLVGVAILPNPYAGP